MAFLFRQGQETPLIVIPAYDMKKILFCCPEGLSLPIPYVMIWLAWAEIFFSCSISLPEGLKISFSETPDMSVKLPHYYQIDLSNFIRKDRR